MKRDHKVYITNSFAMRRNQRYLDVLKGVLEKYKIPGQYYSLGDYKEESVCIEHVGRKWKVYEGARGKKIHSREFKSFYKAGCSLLDSVVDDFKQLLIMKANLWVKLNLAVFGSHIDTAEKKVSFALRMKYEEEFPVFKVTIKNSSDHTIGRVEVISKISNADAKRIWRGEVRKGVVARRKIDSVASVKYVSKEIERPYIRGWRVARYGYYDKDGTRIVLRVARDEVLRKIKPRNHNDILRNNKVSAIHEGDSKVTT